MLLNDEEGLTNATFVCTAEFPSRLGAVNRFCSTGTSRNVAGDWFGESSDAGDGAAADGGVELLRHFCLCGRDAHRQLYRREKRP